MEGKLGKKKWRFVWSCSEDRKSKVNKSKDNINIKRIDGI